jgi:hypothetical protein
MGITALGIALLPSENDMDTLFAINKEYQAANPESFLFSDEKQPHITLLQGYFDWSAIAGGIDEPTPLTVQVELTVSQVNNALDANAPNGELINLHNHFYQQLSSQVTSNGEPKHFFKGEGSIGNAKYVQKFVEKNSLHKYWPHLTLGASNSRHPTVYSAQFPLNITCDRIVCARLGRHCTISSEIFRTFQLQ